MSVTINGTSGVTFNDASSQNTAATGFGFKNRLINSAMVIDQRNAGASVTPTVDGTYTLDRWKVGITQASKFSVQQNAGSVTPPVGFSNYLGCTSLSAFSIGTSDIFAITQAIEGFNTADLNWGTANAKTVTLSFQVYSSLTGTFGGVITNSAQTRSYPFSYSVSVANTWTTISVTIAGDTTGTWVGSTNGKGLSVWFSLGSGASVSGTAGVWASATTYSATGATSVVGTSGATFYITGVQLEKGSTATSFDYRPYGTELALCQRYYQTGNITCYKPSSGGSTALISTQFVVSTRATPTITTLSTSLTIGTGWPFNSATTTSVDFANGTVGEQRQAINFSAASEL